jgi:hypothetical protein
LLVDEAVGVGVAAAGVDGLVAVPVGEGVGVGVGRGGVGVGVGFAGEVEVAVGVEPACAELAAATSAGPGEAVDDCAGTTGALLIAELGDRLGVPAGSRDFAAASPAGVVALAVGRGAGNR